STAARARVVPTIPPPTTAIRLIGPRGWPSPSRPGKRVELHVRHAADRLDDALLHAEARRLHAAERRQLRAVAGDLVDVDGPATELADAAGDRRQVVRDDARGEPVLGAVRDRERLVEVAHPQNRDRRA